MPEIIITFKWDGKTVKTETKGYKGKSCSEATKFLEEGLGAINKKEQLKPEYFAPEVKDPLENKLRF